MVKKVNIGILGCANIARKYAIDAFKSADNTNIIAIASREIKKAKSFASEFGIDYSKSYDDLLYREDIDAVYIPLPIGLHEEWVVKAAKAKKHIICEKSISDNYKSIKRILNACKSNSVVLYENFMCEFHSQHRQVTSLISKGEIGKPLVFKGYFGFPPLGKDNFRYNKGLGGGSLNDAGAYPTFMAMKIFGSEPSAVTCCLKIDKQHNVDIGGSGLLEFSDDRTAFVAFGFDNVYQNNYSVWGSKGKILVNRAYSIPPSMKPQVELLKNENFQEKRMRIDIEPANHFVLIFQDFCGTILKKDKKKVEERYSIINRQAKILEAMRVSAREGRKVKVSEVK